MPFEVDRREDMRGYSGSLEWIERDERGASRKGRQEAAALNDAVFGQVTELHVTKGFPWAHHCDVSPQTLHSRDIIPKSTDDRRRGCVVISNDYLH